MDFAGPNACLDEEKVGVPACALSASKATKARVVRVTFCRVGYFIEYK